MQQSISINSKYFIDRVENDIVQLTKTLSVEHGISIDNAKLMARQIIQRRINQLLTKEEQDGISSIRADINDVIKNTNYSKVSLPALCGDIYELLKTFEL